MPPLNDTLSGGIVFAFGYNNYLAVYLLKACVTHFDELPESARPRCLV